jgi:hypothetical protein
MNNQAKIPAKILAVVLVIFGLMPAMVFVFSALDQSMMMGLFHIPPPHIPGLEKTLIIMGAMATCPAILQFVAAVMLWQGKETGFVISFWMSFILIFAAVYMFACFRLHGINDPSLFAIDFVKGVLLMAFTLYARKKQAAAGRGLSVASQV